LEKGTSSSRKCEQTKGFLRDKAAVLWDTITGKLYFMLNRPNTYCTLFVWHHGGSTYDFCANINEVSKAKLHNIRFPLTENLTLI